MIKLFEKFRYKHDLFSVFTDFLEMASISIANAVDLIHFNKREKRYLEIVNKYSKEEAAIFPQLLGELVTALEKEPRDVLGEVFMQMGLSDSWKGQFFTPMSLAQLMAQMVIQDYESIIKKQGVVTVNEPAVGGGVTIIALALALKEKGYNYQKCLRVVAQDIDIRSVYMSYLQFSLLGIDAVVMRGDTLAYKFDSEVWKTPAHILRWTHTAKKNHENPKLKVAAEETKKTVKYEQLSLFDAI